MEAKTKLTEIKARMEELKKELVDTAKLVIKESVQELFNEWPEVVAVRWTQYTPYFNDGDPCKFGVNEPYVKIGDVEGEFEDEDEWKYAGDFDYGSVEEKRLDALEKDFNSCEEALLTCFGDHAQVTIYRGIKKAKVEYFDHS